jgi:calcium-dependent protein kinase
LKLLQYFPEDRPSASAALQHPWIVKFYNLNDPLNEKLKVGLSNLQSFRTQKTLQKAVLGYIASQELTKEEEENLKEIFLTLDTNKDGKLTLDDLVEGYMALNVKEEVAKKKATKILTRTDINQNGSIDYNEFMMASLNVNKEITKERLKKAFEFIDLVSINSNSRTKME